MKPNDIIIQNSRAVGGNEFKSGKSSQEDSEAPFNTGRRRLMNPISRICFSYPLIFSVLTAVIMITAWPLPSLGGFELGQAKEPVSLPKKTLAQSSGSVASSGDCQPTPPDSLGPFYKPNAPVRSSVGQGYILHGVVRSSKDCSIVAGARIEMWLTGPNGRYDDDHRATVFSDGSGRYRFESNFPPDYAGRPSHIHIRISAAGYRTLITQHYPAKGVREATFDLVVIPTR